MNSNCNSFPSPSSPLLEGERPAVQAKAPAEASLSQEMERRSCSHPERPAMVRGEEWPTYAPREARAGQSSRLQSLQQFSEPEPAPEPLEQFPMTSGQVERCRPSLGSNCCGVGPALFSFALHGPWKEPAWQEAMRHLTSRHSILRISLHPHDGPQPKQKLHAQVEMATSLEDLRPLRPENQLEAVTRHMERERQRPFDSERVPLVRFHLQRLDDGRLQLFVSHHPALLDRASVASLVTELLEDYSWRLLDRSREMPRGRISWQECAQREQQAVASSVCRLFWKGLLHQFPACVVPRWPAKFRGGGLGQMVLPPLRVPGELQSGLERLALLARVPLKTVLLAAHLRVLSLLHSADDIVGGVEMSGRADGLEEEHVLGHFVNTLPLRYQFKPCSWIDLVRETYVVEARLLPYRRFPLAEIEPLQGRRKLFETGFSFVHAHIYRRLENCGPIQLSEGPSWEPTGLTMKTTFVVDSFRSGLRLELAYDAVELARDQALIFREYYMAVFGAMTQDATARQDLFSPGTSGDLRALLRPASRP